jgi:hypothetical protein
MALWSMYGLFSVGWAVAQGCLQGLIQPKGVFLRTPKTRDQTRLGKALQVTRWETGLGLVCGVTALVILAVDFNLTTICLALLLLWKSSLFLSATVYSLLSLVEQPK